MKVNNQPKTIHQKLEIWSTSCVIKDTKLKGALYKDFCSGLNKGGKLRVLDSSNCKGWCNGLSPYANTKQNNECDNIKLDYCTADKDQDINNQDSACACINYGYSDAYHSWYKILNNESKAFTKDPICWAPPYLEPGSLKTTPKCSTPKTTTAVLT